MLLNMHLILRNTGSYPFLIKLIFYRFEICLYMTTNLVKALLNKKKKKGQNKNLKKRNYQN